MTVGLCGKREQYLWYRLGLAILVALFVSPVGGAAPGGSDGAEEFFYLKPHRVKKKKRPQTPQQHTQKAQAPLTSRIKDIATIEGVRSNPLVGYGLVVGLNGTGDRPQSAPFTKESLVSMLERLGVSIRGPHASQIQTQNVAAVIVTAQLPAFARQGTSIDISISALGNAKSLGGGTLLVTPLRGADGEVYAVAQGAISISGFSAGGQGVRGTRTGSSVTQGTPTNGRISNGALVEREIPFQFQNAKDIKISLRNPDFTTAQRTAQVINRSQGRQIATALDPTTVQLRLSPTQNPFELIASIEQLPVHPDRTAKIVINEADGVIAITKGVHIDTVAVSHQNLTINIAESVQASQPNPLASGGQTALVPRSHISVDQGRSPKQMAVLNETANLNDLVQGLNALGLSPRDMIPVFETIKAAGALHAELIVR